MWQIWAPEYGKNHNYTKNQEIKIEGQSKRDKQAHLLLNNDDIIFIYETKTGPKPKTYDVLFHWDDADEPGIVNDKLYVFLEKYFTKKPAIIKTKDKNIIILSDGDKFIPLMLNMSERQSNKKYVEASLTIGDGRTFKCWAENEDNKIVLYDYERLPSRPRKEGRQGIFAVANAQSRFFNHDWSPDEFEDFDRNFDLLADAIITHTDGFVPREKLNTIMEYKPKNLFYGWGIRKIEPAIAQEIMNYYCSQKTPNQKIKNEKEQDNKRFLTTNEYDIHYDKLSERIISAHEIINKKTPRVFGKKIEITTPVIDGVLVQDIRNMTDSELIMLVEAVRKFGCGLSKTILIQNMHFFALKPPGAAPLWFKNIIMEIHKKTGRTAIPYKIPADMLRRN